MTDIVMDNGMSVSPSGELILLEMPQYQRMQKQIEELLKKQEELKTTIDQLECTVERLHEQLMWHPPLALPARDMEV